MRNIYTLIILALLFVGCKEDPKVPVTEVVEMDETPYILEIGRFPQPEIAEDNALTKQGVLLGRMLFYEKMLSKDGSQSCATCHVQENGFSDTAKFSIGVRGLEGKRQAMAIFNMAWNTNEFFWDGRAHLLRDQSLMPIEDELEMDETLENVIKKLSGDQKYLDQFVRAFGTSEITPLNMSLALEQFMNSILSNQSKYDQFLEDSSVFNESELRGLELFTLEYNEFFPEKSGADCAHCHSGLNFEHGRFRNNGLDAEVEFDDLGREAVTNIIDDRGKFKITSLRNIALTPPYMHDGRFATLEEVVEHYNSGIKLSKTLDPAIEQSQKTGLRLTEQDKKDLVNFLKTLTDTEMVNNPDYATPF